MIRSGYPIVVTKTTLTDFRLPIDQAAGAHSQAKDRELIPKV